LISQQSGANLVSYSSCGLRQIGFENSNQSKGERFLLQEPSRAVAAFLYTRQRARALLTRDTRATMASRTTIPTMPTNMPAMAFTLTTMAVELS
jgi:hypothetical protein